MNVKQELKKDCPSITIVLSTLLGTLVMIQLLPDRVPIHFNAQGEADGWGSPWVLILTPLTNLVIWPLLFFLPFMDPRPRKNGPEKFENLLRIMREVRLVNVTFFAFITVVTIIASTGVKLDGVRLVFTACCLLFIYLGNLLTRIPPNWFSGIRTPWTLEDPVVWRKTHRVGGRLFFFGGLILLALVWLAPFGVMVWSFVAWCVLVVIATFFYSWWIWKNSPANDTDKAGTKA
jgi:uncharacterized membrane protein